ncbi:hypothetical protein IFM89_037144, partial [Coptis chinensis]
QFLFFPPIISQIPISPLTTWSILSLPSPLICLMKFVTIMNYSISEYFIFFRKTPSSSRLLHRQLLLDLHHCQLVQKIQDMVLKLGSRRLNGNYLTNQCKQGHQMAILA